MIEIQEMDVQEMEIEENVSEKKERKEESSSDEVAETVGLDDDEDEDFIYLYESNNISPFSCAKEEESKEETEKREKRYEDEVKNAEKFNQNSKRLPIRRKAAQHSKFLMTALEGDDSSEIKEIPVPGCPTEILGYIIEYLEYHQKVPVPENNIKRPLTEKTYRGNVQCQWDCDFLDHVMEIGDKYEHKDHKNVVGKQNLYDLIRAANYMDINPLLLLACSRVAFMIKGVPVADTENILDPRKPL